MPNTQQTQSTLNSLTRRLQQPRRDTTLRSVRQDKTAPTRVRIATIQPVIRKNGARTRHKNTLSPRIKKHSSHRQTVQISGWGKPQLKTQVQLIAKQEGLSLSQTVVAGLEEWVRQQYHIRHAVLLQPIIETTIRKEIRRHFSRMVLFQARITLTLDVIKGLVKWLCRRLAGATKEQVDTVEAQSRKDARLNMTQRTPQLEKLIAEYEKAILDELEGTN